MPQSRDVRHPTRPPSWSKLRQGCFENSALLDAAVYIRTDLNTGLKSKLDERSGYSRQLTIWPSGSESRRREFLRGRSDGADN